MSICSISYGFLKTVEIWWKSEIRIMNEAKARAMKEEMENLVRDSQSGKTMSAQEINRLGGDRLKFDKISDQKVAEAEEKLRKDRMNALQEEMRLFEVNEMKNF